MRAAFYSKNNSYSRSYNATLAEREGRLPRLRAAKELGLSIKAFDLGCSSIRYMPSEWHHVGKYANRVDYYDTTELAGNPLFWKAATTKANATYCKKQISNCFKKTFKEKFTSIVKPQIQLVPVFEDIKVVFNTDNKHNFRKAIIELTRIRSNKPFNPNTVDKRFRYIYLNQDGSTMDRRGKPIQYSLIDWNQYSPEFMIEKGVRFIHNSIV